MQKCGEQLGIYLLVGVTGFVASGKGTFRDLLIDCLKHNNIETYLFSMSDEVRREASKENPQYTRDDLRRVSMTLKKKFGPGVLAKRAIEDIEKTISNGATPKVIVTEAIRNVDEVKEFRNYLDHQFILVAVVAPMDSLVNRVIARQRYDENLTALTDRRKVIEMIEMEMSQESKFGHQIKRCVDGADYIIDNKGALEDLRKKVEDFVNAHLLPRLEL
jgi:dephospho-CoA kinase